MSSDLLLRLGQNPRARQLIKSAGLPIPVPQPLRRAAGPYAERELADRTVVVGGGDGALSPLLADTLARAGADPVVVGGDGAMAAYADPGDAFGRPARHVAPGDAPDDVRASALIFDGTGVRSPRDLRALYDFFHPWIDRLQKNGRVIVLGWAANQANTGAQAAASAALEGFARSLAKEVGSKGSTGHLVAVERGAEGRLAPVLRYLLSDRSAFLSVQPWRVTARARAAAHPVTRPLEGKVALVTGAARGIGASTARVMAREGAKVVCLDRPEDDGPASRIARDVGGEVLLCDVSADDAPAAIRDALLDRHGGVDVVVHNAGVTRDKTLRRMSEDKWDQALDVNLGAVVRITEVLKTKALRDGGRVVCLSSIAGLAGNVGQTNYAASKSGIVGYVEHLAGELADRGITVNAVAPGFIETRLTAAMPVMIREAARRMSALGQGGLPEDVAEAILFLSTPGADGLTASTVRVCGGALVGR